MNGMRAALDSPRLLRDKRPFHALNTMGQQTNKIQKRRRRDAYLKRKKIAVKAATKSKSKAKK